MSQEISEIFTSTIIELKNNGYWQETVPFNFRIFCENVPNICRTFISDFKKILDDIEQGKILKTTIKLMENIYRVSVENEERSWKTFKDDHDWHVYSNKNFQAAEKLYQEGRDFFVTLRDVSNATARMEDYSIEGMIHTQYIITSDGTLRIECGRFSKKTAPIPVSQITDIAKSKSWEAAPALSLDRLKISYRKGTIKTYALISPQNAEAFVRCLKKQNDSINVSI